MVEYESNLVTYCISQQIKGLNPSNSSHHIAMNTENMILKLTKFVLNCTDLGQMLDTKTMPLVEIFPTVYHSHLFNISFVNCGKIIWCPSLENRRTVIQNFKNYPVDIFD
jgi:hypothetical protein